MVIVVVICAIVACIISFICGYRYAINSKAKKMIEQMNMGEIILDLSNSSDETIKCQFDKSPREMLGLNFILLEVKIRQ